MTVVPRAVLLVALVATTGLTTVLGITDPSAPTVYPTRFLIWNLALAWVPLVMAVGFAALSRSVWQLPWLLGWLVFLPNTVYLVTDLSHLGEGVDLWRHVLQYGFAAWTGIMLGQHARVGAVAVREPPVDGGGAGRSSVLRAGLPDHLVARGAYGRKE